MVAKSEIGFTIIEILVVIAVIGILSAIAIPQFSAYRTRVFNTSAKSQVRNVVTLLEAYYNDNHSYVLDTSALNGYTEDKYIKITITAGATNNISDSYTITGAHYQGNMTYTVSGPGGLITGS